MVEFGFFASCTYMQHVPLVAVTVALQGLTDVDSAGTLASLVLVKPLVN